MSESLFNKVIGVACSLSRLQVFSCEFYEVSKNTFFTEHLRTTASESKTFMRLSVIFEGFQPKHLLIWFLFFMKHTSMLILKINPDVNPLSARPTKWTNTLKQLPAI